MARTACQIAGLLHNRKCLKPANPTIEEQSKAPQLSERRVSPETAAEVLQMRVRRIMPTARLEHITAYPMEYRQRKKWRKGGRVAYT
jgi:hypothetical protein